MKPHTREMIEGPEAAARFQRALKAIVAVPKSAVPKPGRKTKKPTQK
jgi:hypothetical protein